MKTKLNDEQINFIHKYKKTYNVDPYLSVYQYINNHVNELDYEQNEAFYLCNNYLKSRKIYLLKADYLLLKSIFTFILNEKQNKFFYKSKFIEYLELISKGNKELFESKLKFYTQFIKKNGEIQQGVKSIDDLSFSRLKIAYGKIKEDYKLQEVK